MPIKGQSPKEVIHTELHKFKHGQLHSGSKHGPKVTNRKQAVAIAMSESGKSKGYDRSSHHPGNPGFGKHVEAANSPPHHHAPGLHSKGERNGMEGGPSSAEAARNCGSGDSFVHRAPPMRNAHVFCGTGPVSGHLRMSGVKGAHRIGKK